VIEKAQHLIDGVGLLRGMDDALDQLGIEMFFSFVGGGVEQC